MNSYKKVMPALALSFAAIASTASADVSSTDHLNQAPCGANKNVNLSSSMNGGSGISVQGDLFMWNTDQDGLLFGIQENDISKATQSPYAQNGTAVVDGKALKADPKSNFGFKLGAGYQLPHDGWDLFVQWTHHKADQKNSAKVAGNATANIRTSLQMPGLPVNMAAPLNGTNTFHMAYGAASKLDIATNLVDVELGKEFRPQNTPWFSLRPHFGLRYAKVEQKWNTVYSRDVDLAAQAIDRTDDATIFTDTVKLGQDYRGFGLRTGVDAEFGWKHGLAVYGKFAASVLYSDYKSISFSETIDASNVATAHTAPFTYKTSSSLSSGKFVTDLDLGVQWEKMFNDDKLGLTIKAGWEHHLFVNHNQMIRFVDGGSGGNYVGNHGDLAFHGFKINAKFDF